MSSGSEAGEGFRSGFVAVIGRPNVGKSTLVNLMVGQKVSIVSDKPQTTRRPVRGVLNGPGFQAVFTDTPGFHKPRTALGERLNERVGESVADVEMILMVVDAAAGVGRGDAFVAARKVAPFGGPKVCAVNKVDALRHRGPRGTVPQLEAAAALASFDHVMPVSARTGAGVGELRDLLVGLLPPGPPLFPAEMATDQTLEFRIAETVREKALALTREEVPHSVATMVEELSRDDVTGFVSVSCLVLVERDSQKGILIGRGGEMLKRIGTAARKELETLLGSKVYLELRVKVLKDWQRDPRSLDSLGL